MVSHYILWDVTPPSLGFVVHPVIGMCDVQWEHILVGRVWFFFQWVSSALKSLQDFLLFFISSFLLSFFTVIFFLLLYSLIYYSFFIFLSHAFHTNAKILILTSSIKQTRKGKKN